MSLFVLESHFEMGSGMERLPMMVPFKSFTTDMSPSRRNQVFDIQRPSRKTL